MSWIHGIDGSHCLGRLRTRGRCGFTLIEVLVVVAVITLLIAILIPSLARSREQARSVKCRTQLKEWGNAMLMYTQAFGDYLPFEDRPVPSEDRDGDRVFDEEGWYCWYDALDRFFGASTEADEGVKVCPTVRRRDPSRQESYRMNSKLAETNEASPYYRPYRKYNTLKRLPQTVVLFDGDVGGDRVSFKGRWRKANDDVNYRHVRATNVLFADWHVENLLRDVVNARSFNNEPIVWQPADIGPWNPGGGGIPAP